MASTSPYQILKIPKPLPEPATEETWMQLAQKFRTLRLKALKTNPEAFGSSYEAEIDRPLEQTLERLRNPKAAHFIAVRKDGDVALSSDIEAIGGIDAERDLESLLSSQWVGMLALLGPKEEDDYDVHRDGGKRNNLPSMTSDPFARMTSTAKSRAAGDLQAVSSTAAESENKKCLNYHIGATFVSKSARRAGLGAALMQRAKDTGRMEGERQVCEIRIGIAVNQHNIGARDLYLRAGFRIVGEERYTQLPRLIDGEMKRLELMAYKMECRIPLTAVARS